MIRLHSLMKCCITYYNHRNSWKHLFTSLNSHDICWIVQWSQRNQFLKFLLHFFGYKN